MTRPKGRAFLHTDGGARSVDRLVRREVSLTLYPTSSSGDNPIEATFVVFDEGRKIRAVITQRNERGEKKILADIRTSNRM